MFAYAPGHISWERTRGTPAGDRDSILTSRQRGFPGRCRTSPPDATAGAEGFLDCTEPPPRAQVREAPGAPTGFRRGLQSARQIALAPGVRRCLLGARPSPRLGKRTHSKTRGVSEDASTHYQPLQSAKQITPVGLRREGLTAVGSPRSKASRWHVEPPREILRPTHPNFSDSNKYIGWFDTLGETPLGRLPQHGTPTIPYTGPGTQSAHPPSAPGPRPPGVTLRDGPRGVFPNYRGRAAESSRVIYHGHAAPLTPPYAQQQTTGLQPDPGSTPMERRGG